jgi:hypothetical protein
MATGGPSIKSDSSGKCWSKQAEQSNMRRIFRPLMAVAGLGGLSVWHADKRVMRVKIAYFVLANIFVLTTPAICIWDMMNVLNEHV